MTAISRTFLALALATCLPSTLLAGNLRRGLGPNTAGTTTPKFRVRVKYSEFGELSPLEGATVTCFVKDESLIGQDSERDVRRASTRITPITTTNSNGRAVVGTKKNKKGQVKKGDAVYCKIEGHNIFTSYTKTKKVIKDVVNFDTITVGPDRRARGDPGYYNNCGDYDVPNRTRDFVDDVYRISDACSNFDLCYQNCHETVDTCNEEYRRMGYSSCTGSHSTKFGLGLCFFYAETSLRYIQWYQLDFVFALNARFGSEILWDFEDYQVLGNCIKEAYDGEREYLLDLLQDPLESPGVQFNGNSTQERRYRRRGNKKRRKDKDDGVR